MGKIICGDCLMELQTIESQTVSCVITDPPYGILTSGKTIVKGYQKDTYDDHCQWDNIKEFETFTKQWLQLCLSCLRPDSFMFVFWSQKLLKLGFNLFNPNRMVLWRYNNLTLGGGGNFAYDYEPIFVIKNGKPKLAPGKHSCDMEFTKPQSTFNTDKLIHPTQKPLKLLEHLINIATQPGDLILDPFGGSGTTYVAALNLNRQCIIIEKEQQYVDMIYLRSMSNTL